MNLYKYKNKDEYRRIQEAGNIKKLHCTFVNEKVIDTISEYIIRNIKNPTLGICHGTRRGVEQQLLIDKTGAAVIGTEISSTATQFPHTIKWDFHDVKSEWINNVDFIYSNSLDHSYDPKFALSQWLKCLNDNGLCFIEYTAFNKQFSKLDCFSSSRGEMGELIRSVGDVQCMIKVRDYHQGRPRNKPRRMNYFIFVVKKKV